MSRLPLNFTRAFLLLSAISAIGCSANQSVPTETSGAIRPMTLLRLQLSDPERIFAATTAATDLPRVHRNQRKSWMATGAGKRLLLYISSVGDGSVDIYDYKTGKQYGQLTGLQYPYGQCVDREGDVYVTQFFGAAVTEYAHGATSPTRTISGPGYPIGCSVDPSTGDLAVSSWVDAYGSSQCGGVWIYPNATGTPNLYTDPKICQGYWPPGYDPNGDLFVEVDGPPTYLEELPRGSSAFTELSLQGGVIHLPTSVMWHGHYLIGGDQQYRGGNTTAIYRFALSGSTATITRTTKLTDTCAPSGHYTDVVQPFIYGKGKRTRIIGGNLWCKYRFDDWKYPKGRNPMRTLPSDVAPQSPYGQSLSPP